MANNTYQDIDIYRGSYSVEQLQTIRRTLAKRANQRIVRLERGASEITGEQFNTYGAVIDAYDYLEKQKAGRTRFREQKNAFTDQQDLKREITVLQGFLGRKSSLVSGMRDIERKRVSTFETGQWGTRYRQTGIPTTPIHFASNKEFYDFLNSETFKGLVASGFTSEQIVEIYDQARVKNDDADKTVKDMQSALDEYRAKGNASLKDLIRRLGVKPLIKR